MKRVRKCMCLELHKAVDRDVGVSLTLNVRPTSFLHAVTDLGYVYNSDSPPRQPANRS